MPHRRDQKIALHLFRLIFASVFGNMNLSPAKNRVLTPFWFVPGVSSAGSAFLYEEVGALSRRVKTSVSDRFLLVNIVNIAVNIVFPTFIGPQQLFCSETASILQ
jgi:hypothetical protein